MARLFDLPASLLATVLAFVSRTSEGIACCAVTCRQAERRLGLGETQEEEEELWMGLTQAAWRLTNERFAQWPRLGSWRRLYRLLEAWAPREGFYVMPETYPWGLLVLLRFNEGRFTGEVLWPRKDEAGVVHFEKSLVLEIAFEPAAGEVAEARMCGSSCDLLLEDGMLYLLAEPAPAGHRGPRIRARRVSNQINERIHRMLLPRVGTSEAISVLQGPAEVRRAWNPGNANVSVPDMVRATWNWRCARGKLRPPGADPAERGLSLSWIDGPARNPDFVYHEGMPVLRPGIYAGCYHAMYGKFQNEYILIEYRRYALDLDANGEAPQATWDTIANEIFNVSGSQSDEQGLFRGVQQCAREERAAELVFVVGRKITGDLHVPMSAITFGALVHPARPGRDLNAVVDRGDGREPPMPIPVARTFTGWGTLAMPAFRRPSWDAGTLVQLENEGDEAHHKFGFLWERDGGDTSAAIMRWVPEQDSFPWAFDGGR